ncbi:DUF5359 family protein [Bacillus sp. EB600]|uniref:DUF5359 family protein n=1 Tax=Bacillus sp. EB600 TaxID=2806345 RepID=UPI002109C1AB|nr:DUF5359 family protein [Bacillus sp. EB600]MCQ6277936.1 DUF5359 family protein [Bacillus sp. EB600]
MKTIERVLIKMAVIQLLFLLLSQFIFHQLNPFPQLKQITIYEGVTKNTLIEIVETFSDK